MSEIGNPCAIGWFDYLKLNFSSKCICDRDMSGKVVIITGANSGIGYAACAALADKGAEVVMACRDKDRARQAFKQLKKGKRARSLSVELVDMANIQSIKDFARRINARYETIDVLLNNAGVLTRSELTADGFEVHFATICMGRFLLTNLLLQKLSRSQDARIINVTSDLHRLGRYDPKGFAQRKGSMLLPYADSNLCNVLFTKELSRRLRGTSVSVFAVSPGVMNTNLLRDYEKSLFGFIISKSMNSFGRWMVKDAKQGVQSILHSILNKNITEYSGSYISECAVTTSSAASKDIDNAEELWELCVEYTGLYDGRQDGSYRV